MIFENIIFEPRKISYCSPKMHSWYKIRILFRQEQIFFPTRGFGIKVLSSWGKIIFFFVVWKEFSQYGYKAPEALCGLSLDCLIFEHRDVIPPNLRDNRLRDSNAVHLDIVKMKGNARSFVNWPGIYVDIEREAKSCTDCAMTAHLPIQFGENHWEYPNLWRVPQLSLY